MHRMFCYGVVICSVSCSLHSSALCIPRWSILWCCWTPMDLYPQIRCDHGFSLIITLSILPLPYLLSRETKMELQITKVTHRPTHSQNLENVENCSVIASRLAHLRRAFRACRQLWLCPPCCLFHFSDRKEWSAWWSRGWMRCCSLTERETRGRREFTLTRKRLRGHCIISALKKDAQASALCLVVTVVR